jgi:hypothetical protein
MLKSDRTNLGRCSNRNFEITMKIIVCIWLLLVLIIIIISVKEIIIPELLLLLFIIWNLRLWH